MLTILFSEAIECTMLEANFGTNSIEDVLSVTVFDKVNIGRYCLQIFILQISLDFEY